MVASSYLYLSSYDGSHDYYQWQMHMWAWGQNQVAFFIMIIFNNEITRAAYYVSTFGTALVAYLGAPIYILWLAFFHYFEANGTYSFVYFAETLAGWLAYIFVLRQYSLAIIPSVYNYWMIPVSEELGE